MNLPDFSKIFHRSSKDHVKGAQGQVPIKHLYPQGWPKEWSTTYYKTYPRLPKIEFEDYPPEADFFELIKKRKSRRDFLRTPVTKRDLSLLLKYSCGNTEPIELEPGRFHRAQPSGGARFPIEVYPVVFRSENGLKAGLYHYDVKNHQLNVLWNREFSDEEIAKFFTYPFVKDAALAIIMTAVFERTQNKYGERGYRYVLLEAGHIGQNIYLVSEALGLKCCAITGSWDENLEKLIDIDGVTESVVYAVAVGK